MNENKISHWKEFEIKKLFTLVEDYKKQNLSLSKCFSTYANLTNRKPNSVRNYYYQELSFLENNPDQCKKLKIDITKHLKVVGKSFTKEETNELIKNIINLTNKGYSVRKACLELANNDVNEMVRLQNKYRSVISKDSELLNTTLNSLKEKGIFKKQPSNITVLPVRKNKLNDNDIQSLFLGLVNIVKKSAEENANTTLKNQLQEANNNLRKTLVELTKKEIEILNLRKEFKMLSTKNDTLTKQLSYLKIKTAQLSKSKMEKLENYLTSKNTELSKKTN